MIFLLKLVFSNNCDEQSLQILQSLLDFIAIAHLFSYGKGALATWTMYNIIFNELDTTKIWMGVKVRL